MMYQSLKIGIVILNWNNYEDTKETLEGIKKQIYKNYEVVVVDGKSSDDSTYRIQKEFPDYNYIYLQEDVGYTGGNNAGIRFFLEKNCPLILSMNNDVILNPNCLCILSDYMGNHKDAGIIGPRIFSYSNRNVFELEGGYVNILTSKPQPKWAEKGKLDERFNKPYIVKKLPGACVLLKREIVKTVGLMDEDFFLYYGDSDWQKRISDAGWKQIVVPEAEAYHKVSSTTKKIAYKIYYYDAREFLRYVYKHYNFLTLVYNMIIFYLTRAWAALKHGNLKNGFVRLKYITLAYIDFVRGIKGKSI